MLYKSNVLRKKQISHFTKTIFTYFCPISEMMEQEFLRCSAFFRLSSSISAYVSLSILINQLFFYYEHFCCKPEF
jgi:hypothetical protein